MAGERIDLRAGSLVFREGDLPTTAFLIESGEIEVIAGLETTPVFLGRLGPGDLLGEMAVIDDAPRTASARAVTDCVLLPVARDQLHERIDHADPVVRALLRAQLARYRSALQTLRGADSTPVSPAPDRAESQSAAGVADKLRLESELRDALAARALEVRYQPILDLRSQRIAGYEALIRWDHPQRGPVSPAEFIRIAEETSLIVPVGRYVFGEVFDLLARLQRDGRQLPFVAVNVSARQLAEEDVVAMMAEIADAAGVAPSAAKIEITESLTLDIDAVAALIARAHARGILVALDDFGTGSSNLGHLHKLHFDTVKLDQGFVRQMLGAPRCYAIVEAITAMVAALGADMVAEGVETEAQRDALSAMGCRYAQGWLIGKAQARDVLLARPEGVGSTHSG
jgi:EAL domain-containing protein (putative c-di-GMP-specific phosphodiesterase class I)